MSPEPVQRAAALHQLDKIEERVRDKPDQAAIISKLRQMVSNKFEDAILAFAAVHA